MTDRLTEQAQIARRASLELANLQTSRKNQVLQAIAGNLRLNRQKILQANALDQVQAKAIMETGKLSASAFARVSLNEKKIEQMALNMESVARLPDPVGKIERGTRLADGLELYRVSCPLGVILAIFESRPEVVAQISALAIKSGNAVILKGGSEAQHSNQALARLIGETLARFDFMPQGTMSLLNTRAQVSRILQAADCIDLIVPRGSNSLVRYVQAHSRVPVLAHADGICHVYLDCRADLGKSEEIVLDAKLQYPAVCNAMETMLVHRAFPRSSLVDILKKLQDAEVDLRVCETTRQRLQGIDSLRLKEALPDDWVTEYGDLILSVKTVSSLQEAVEHINAFGSKHTDAIVTENKEKAEWFMNQVDAANVFWNASTRFSDGFRYGFGAEVGISTSKTHARGPVGLEGLVIYKYKLYGQGQSVGRFEGSGADYLHEAIPPVL